MASLSSQLTSGSGRAASRPTTGSQHAVRIVTYNILADKYSGNHPYCPPQYLDVNYRRKLLLKQLQLLAPDLLCMQEVQEDVFQDVLKPWMEQHGYGSLYAPRPRAPDSTTLGPLDGVSLHYREDMFRLQSSQAVKFADHAQQVLPAVCCQASRTSQQQQQQRRRQRQQQSLPDPDRSGFIRALVQRQEGAQLALLQHTPSRQQLVVCSTHLHWNPSFPDVKLAQASILCHCIQSFIEAQQAQQGVNSHDLQGMPVVVGGDFNSVWQKHESDAWDEVPRDTSLMSGVYQLMSTGYVGPSHPDHNSQRRACQCSTTNQRQRPGSQQRPQQADSQAQQQQQQPQQQEPPLSEFVFTAGGLQLESSHYSRHKREPTLTTRTDTFSGCLDYIWLSKQHWRVQETLPMPYAEPDGAPGPPRGVPMHKLGACPSKEQPSDHLAVGCDAVLLKVPAVQPVRQDCEVVPDVVTVSS